MASNFKSSAVNTVGVTNTTLYTAPAATQTTVIGLSMANVIGANITVTAFITKGATSTRVIKDAPIPTGSSLILFGGDQKLVLEAGNTF
jgi:hypothetical protein